MRLLRTLLIPTAAAAVLLTPLAAQAATLAPSAASAGVSVGNGSPSSCDSSTMNGRIDNGLSQPLDFSAAGVKSGMSFIDFPQTISPGKSADFEHRGRDEMPGLPRLGAGGLLIYKVGDTGDTITFFWDRFTTPGTARAEAVNADGSAGTKYDIKIAQDQCSPVPFSVSLKS